MTKIFIVRVIEEPKNPCNPSPCGINAICKELNGIGSCTCISEYFGDPYVECRPECIMNNDCARDKACINNKCRNPCPGTCGINAECFVNNHIPTCICFAQYTGNPLTSCHLIPASKNKLNNLNLRFSIMFLYFYSNSTANSIRSLCSITLWPI